MLLRAAKRLRRIAALLKEEGPGNVLAVFAVAASVPAIMCLPLRRVQGLIEPRATPEAPLDPRAVERTIRRVESVIALGRPIVRKGCLTRGVTLYYFLRRRGLPVELCFGMGQPHGAYDGHCWLIRDGEPYLERIDPRELYTEVCRIPRLPERSPRTILRAARK